uniref:Thioredoxin n=1 Tax=Lilium longiflorum TaxID=4690 RepID=Q40230_LILLO|nr:thioredoxin [Lilium longiflorum]
MVDAVSRCDVFLPCQHRPAVPVPVSHVRFKFSFPVLESNFLGTRLVIKQSKAIHQNSNPQAISVQMALSIGKAMKWWEKGLHPNMKEITSAQDLVYSLQNAGNKLVIVDFFSPGCGGCRALHPKICQFAEMNLDVQFLQVNYEEHKSMAYSLNVHVLPFFRFYRGAHGRLCSFSCTNATIKKFRDALAKHNTDRCSLGPTKGLEEKELVALAANRELGFSYTPKPEHEPVHQPDALPKPARPSPKVPLTRDAEEKVLAGAGR